MTSVTVILVVTNSWEGYKIRCPMRYRISSYKALPRIIPAFLIIPAPDTLLCRWNLLISNNTRSWRPNEKNYTRGSYMRKYCIYNQETKDLIFYANPFSGGASEGEQNWVFKKSRMKLIGSKFEFLKKWSTELFLNLIFIWYLAVISTKFLILYNQYYHILSGGVLWTRVNLKSEWQLFSAFFWGV